MRSFGKEKLEFTAKFLADIAKAIFAVGLASSFFRDFPGWLRYEMGVSFVLLAIWSIAIHPDKKGD